ncbi:MAG: 50S ribosomal protein L9 [Spirochaetaceae bacterium]|jgi:large subunit ribosomal protein L9|nr:50S ribosomal protein L9 [Spirochaetaceae bacterium]
MKVILNKDLNTLGEEGDVKDVAKGYARNYLFPRGIALPYTEKNIKKFESRREEIEARKAAKRHDAMGLKERLEALELVISMPAGANGKLYGAVTSQTVADELTRQGFPTERKRVELPGNSFKSVGKYKVTVKLYESASAEIGLTVEAQVIKVEPRRPAPVRKDRHRRGEQAEGQAVEAPAVEAQAAEVSAGEEPSVAGGVPAAETPDQA